MSMHSTIDLFIVDLVRDTRWESLKNQFQNKLREKSGADGVPKMILLTSGHFGRRCPS